MAGIKKKRKGSANLPGLSKSQIRWLCSLVSLRAVARSRGACLIWFVGQVWRQPPDHYRVVREKNGHREQLQTYRKVQRRAKGLVLNLELEWQRNITPTMSTYPWSASSYVSPHVSPLVDKRCSPIPLPNPPPLDRHFSRHDANQPSWPRSRPRARLRRPLDLVRWQKVDVSGGTMAFTDGWTTRVAGPWALDTKGERRESSGVP